MGDSGQLPSTPPERDRRGRYAPGQSGNYRGRPRTGFAELCRAIVERHRLPGMLAAMACATGQFRKIDFGSRLKAVQILLHYGYGPPLIPADEVGDDVPRVVVVKRIVVDHPEAL
jgi:hypothetical protein